MEVLQSFWKLPSLFQRKWDNEGKNDEGHSHSVLIHIDVDKDRNLDGVENTIDGSNSGGKNTSAAFSGKAANTAKCNSATESFHYNEQNLKNLQPNSITTNSDIHANLNRYGEQPHQQKGGRSDDEYSPIRSQGKVIEMRTPVKSNVTRLNLNQNENEIRMAARRSKDEVFMPDLLSDSNDVTFKHETKAGMKGEIPIPISSFLGRRPRLTSSQTVHFNDDGDNIRSKGYENEDDDEEDEDSVHSNNTLEVFKGVTVQIGKRNGIISIIDHQDEAEEEAENRMFQDAGQTEGIKGDGLSGADTDVLNATDAVQQHDRLREQDAIENLLHSDTGENSTRTPLPQRAFELIPTKNQSHKNFLRKEYHQTRKECLEAAADAYKNASMKVPDSILAQINNHRNALHGSKVDTKDSMNDNLDVYQNSIDYMQNRDQYEQHLTHKNSARPKKKKRKIIKLSKKDEIHVAPCQCALRLVGMRERQISFDDYENTFGGSSRDSSGSSSEIGSLFGLHLFGMDGFSSSDARSGSISRSSSVSTKHVRTVSTFYREDKSDSNRGTKVDGSRRDDALRKSGLARTFSAQVDNSRNAKNKKVGIHQRCVPVSEDFNVRCQKENEEKNDSLRKTFFHGRSDSNLFTSLGYHEITLICKDDHNSRKSKREDGSTSEKFVSWEAVTIRCSSHDELDLLVKSLRDSSNAKVIPFSTNPKERLKKLRKERKKQIARARAKAKERVAVDSPVMPEHDYAVGGNNAIVIDNSGTAPTGEKRKMDQNREKSYLDGIEPSYTEEIRSDLLPTEVEKMSNKAVQSTKEKRKPWDLTFNKKEYCEVCDLTFTLLTRRHHCRKCEISCCGHCSRLLIVEGCDEKRFCNRCASIILQKQSEALRGRLRNSINDTSLPGKVHDACKGLGVGTVGRLPHWKTFLQPNLENRPAVGRLTVEVIEAIALPSVDKVNGKVDPYVRVTITGYDRDMKWTLRQWLHRNRFSLCTRFCSGTLSPQWRGTGRKGGELLTLPVISTAGAVLRLEVLHYDVLKNSRGKDVVLGTVEIPLSDITNANLRDPAKELTSDGKRKGSAFDGYCDRWYRLLPSEELDSKSILLSKPIVSSELRSSQIGGVRKKGMHSLEEVGKRVQALAIAPVEWIASAIKLDLPARPEAIYHEHKKRSMIHVRIKLNASIFGDAISHAWFPPVRPYPIPPAYDPNILLSRLKQVGSLSAPYRKLIKYIEFCIKWKHEPKVCIKAYFVFASHLVLFPYVLPLFHLYLFIFLATQLRQMRLEDDCDVLETSIHCSDSSDGLIGPTEIVGENNEISRRTDDGMLETSAPPIYSTDAFVNDTEIRSSPSLQELSRKSDQQTKIGTQISSTGQSSSNASLANATDKMNASISTKSDSSEEEVTKLNMALHWIATRLGEDKGLEILQFKLGLLARDLKNINSIWNGDKPLLTRAAMVYLVISCILHFVVNQRLLWLMGTSTWYFAQAPFSILTARFMFGFWRGIAKVTRRKHLLDTETYTSLK